MYDRLKATTSAMKLQNFMKMMSPKEASNTKDNKEADVDKAGGDRDLGASSRAAGDVEELTEEKITKTKSGE